VKDNSIEKVVEALLELAEKVGKREQDGHSTTEDPGETSSDGDISELPWMPKSKKPSRKPD
jgi:hypothetical protein